MSNFWCAEDGACQCLARWYVADYVVPLGEVRVAFRVKEGFCSLAHAEGAEVVAAHDWSVKVVVIVASGSVYDDSMEGADIARKAQWVWVLVVAARLS